MVEVTQDKETLREAVARAYWSVALKNGLANDLRQWDERQWKDGEFDCFSPAVDSKTKALVLEAMDAAIATVFELLREAVKETPSLTVDLIRQENYSGEHREWKEPITFPRNAEFYETVLEAIIATAFQQENSDAD